MKKIIGIIMTALMISSTVSAYYTTTYTYDYGNYGTVQSYDSYGNSSYGSYYDNGNSGSYYLYDNNGNSLQGTWYSY